MVRFIGPRIASSRFAPLLLCAATGVACTRGSPFAAKPPASDGAAVASATIPTGVQAHTPLVVRGDAARSGSGIVLADVDGRRIAYVSDEDAALVRVIDLEDEHELSTFALPAHGVPAQMVMLPDGRLIVAVRDGASLLVLRGAGVPGSPLVIDVTIDVAAEPIGLALTHDDRTLVATSGWGHTVTVIETSTFVRKATHSVAREPRTVVIASDDSRAFVSHAVGERLDVIPLAATAFPPPKPIAVGGRAEVVSHHGFLNGQPRASCQGFALARSENGRVFAPHVLVFSGEREITTGYGGSEEEGREAEVFHVPVIDEDTATLVAESKTLRSGLATGPRCALPRAAVVGKAGLYVTCLGENTVELLDADALNPHDVGVKRWRVPAGPTAIALDESNHRAIVWSQFAHSLTTIAIGEDGLAESAPFSLSSLTLVRPNEDAKVERGRVLFHATTDLRISSDGRACASCHPDGRDDSLVWSSPKGLRQTPILAGRLHGAAPFGWNGDAPDVSKHLVQTVKRLGGTGLDGADKEALMAYVDTMRPPPTRSRSTASTSDAVRHGEAIFRSEEAGCASCHGTSGDLPDGSQHDVKSRGFLDMQATFDTPSLKFVGGSAPYFHDGRYPDLKTLLVKSDGKMGHTKHLSPTELADLTTYLETL